MRPGPCACDYRPVPVLAGESVHHPYAEPGAVVETMQRTGQNLTHAARELGLSRGGLLKKTNLIGLR